MTVGEIEYAVRKAHETFDRWNDVTGCIHPLSGHYYEVLAVITDAVHIGAQVALGITLQFDDDGELRGDYGKVPKDLILRARELSR